MLFPTPLRSHFRRSFEKNLQLRARENHRADVPPFHHHASARTGALLLGNKNFAHAGDRRKPRRRLRHFRGSDLLRHFFRIKKYSIFRAGRFLLRSWRFQLDMRRASQFVKRQKIVERNLLPQSFKRQRAIHRATIEIQIAESLRDAFRQAALPRARRSVNGNGKFWHLGSTANLGCVHFCK